MKNSILVKFSQTNTTIVDLREVAAIQSIEGSHYLVLKGGNTIPYDSSISNDKLIENWRRIVDGVDV